MGVAAAPAVAAYRHVYVHVPFCARRCAYCDFAIAVRREVPVDEYLDALARELAARASELGAAADRAALTSLYLGGGTPSRLGARGVADLLTLMESHFAFAPRAEITLEANPEDVSLDAVRSWRASGVNRVSLGVQSFDDGVLRWMHRTHGADDARRAFETIRRGGIDNVSLDLIFSVPAALQRDWKRDLAEAIALCPAHISLYGLTIEAHTPLGRWSARGETVEAPEERYEDEFLLAHASLASAGFEHYEVSNFAQPGCHAVHNSAYWSGAPYLGLGPSAHGFDGVTRRWNVREFSAWSAACRAGHDPSAGAEELTAENRVAEGVYLGLRTARGLVADDRDRGAIDRWTEAGWIERVASETNRVRCTPAGWLRLDSLAASLTTLRSR